jgi:phosphoribosylformylglycinamidine synthase PurS subunit
MAVLAGPGWAGSTRGASIGGSSALKGADFLMKARITITLKSGVLDPQGKAIQNALASLGFSGVNEVRQGKYIEVDLLESNEGKAREQVDKICRDLLANTVIENYAYELMQ